MHVVSTRTLTEPAAEREAPRGQPVVTELLGTAASAGLALAAAVGVLRLWRASLNIPLSPAGDTMLSLMIVKSMQTTGWYQSSGELGAPFGQDLTAYPAMVGDLWHMVGLKLLSLVLTPAATVNVFFVLGFPVIAAVAYACLRLLRISIPIAVTLGALYALLPFHFLRSESHLLLSAYWAVPIACIIAVAVYTGQLTVWRRPRRLRAAAWWALGGAVVLAGTGLYYAVFAIVLITAAGVLRSLVTRTWRPTLSAAVLVTTIGVCLALAALPNLLHVGPPGSNTAVEGRTYGATEFYGLKITNLLLPLGIHRIPLLAHLRQRTGDSPIPGEGSETLGILGAIGLVAVVLAVLLPRVTARGALARRLEPLGALTVVTLLVGTVAGVNSLVAAAGFAELRAWNRISVVVAFLALGGLGHLFDAARRRRRSPGRVARLLVPAAAALVLAVGAYDQTSPQMIPDYPATAAAWNADAVYFQRVQDELGAGAALFALPYARFPENPPIVNMPDYSHLRGFLHSDLRWSYGGVKNGESEWQPVALEDGIAAALPKLVVAGFDAVYINRSGYADAGAEVEAEIISVIGPQVPLSSPDHTLAVYDLGRYAQQLRDSGEPLPSRTSVLYPVRWAFGTGFYPEETGKTDRWRWAQGTAEMTLTNPSSEPVKVTLRGAVRVADPSATTTVRIGAEDSVLRPVSGLAELKLVTTIAPGETRVQFTTDSGPTPSMPGDPRDLRQQVLNLTVEALDAQG